jgi:hypothetical protein
VFPPLQEITKKGRLFHKQQPIFLNDKKLEQGDDGEQIDH